MTDDKPYKILWNRGFYEDGLVMDGKHFATAEEALGKARAEHTAGYRLVGSRVEDEGIGGLALCH